MRENKLEEVSSFDPGRSAPLSYGPSPKRLRSQSRAHSSGAHAATHAVKTTTEPESKRAVSPAATTGGWGWEAGAWWETGGRNAFSGSAPWAAP